MKRYNYVMDNLVFELGKTLILVFQFTLNQDIFTVHF